MAEADTIKIITVNAVIFREDLYPRIKTSAETVQKYAEDLSVLPPIEVNQHYELIDGWHRWTAHKKIQAENIEVQITETNSDSDFLELAIERNARHGFQLSQDDKRDMARRIYNSTAERDRDEKKKRLAQILSVADRTIRLWLADSDKQAKESRDIRIFEAWMRCETQKEIAERENLGKATVNEICSEMADLPKANKATRDAAKHEDEEFQIPLYTVWAKQSKTEGPTHFGNSEIRWVDNLIYLYTQPFDVVADFFAGSGSTIDICRKRSRRYWVSDRKPVVEREKEIRKLDIAGGLPRLPWEDVRLVYLDPPYWKQAQNEYSEDSEDLANMPLDEFTHILTGLITETAKKMTAGHIALLMQPTQWNAPDHQFTDHNVDILRRIKLPIATRIQAPYSTQQCLPQMVNWAKANKQLLVISREIIVWKVG